MTICIAAICKNDDEENIVFATDHMVSLRPLGQFEHSIEKYKVINENPDDPPSVALLAGQPLLFDSLTKVTSYSSYQQIKSQIIKNFKKKRQNLVQNQIFDIFGIDEEFFKQCLQSPHPSNAMNLMDLILDKVGNFSLNTLILLIGFEENLGRITEISEGGCLDYRDINFHAIGSGDIQAVNTLLFQKQSKTDNLKVTVYNVYKAKRNAEVAEGVGWDTDLLVLNKDGVNKLNKDQLKILSKIYKEESKIGKSHPDLDTLGI